MTEHEFSKINSDIHHYCYFATALEQDKVILEQI